MTRATAARQYEVTAARVLEQLDTLRDAVLSLDNSGGINWGHVGSLAHVQSQLDELVRHLAGLAPEKISTK